jgi:Fe-S-cluster containining protein
MSSPDNTVSLSLDCPGTVGTSRAHPRRCAIEQARPLICRPLLWFSADQGDGQVCGHGDALKELSGASSIY